jgi:hypothetical protein
MWPNPRDAYATPERLANAFVELGVAHPARFYSGNPEPLGDAGDAIKLQRAA